MNELTKGEAGWNIRLALMDYINCKDIVNSGLNKEEILEELQKEIEKEMTRLNFDW